MNKITAIFCQTYTDGTIEVGIKRPNRLLRRYYTPSPTRANQVADHCTDKVNNGAARTIMLYHDGWSIYFKRSEK
jgi:hypothetical protein